MVNRVPWEGSWPSLGTSLGTSFTMIHPWLFHIVSQYWVSADEFKVEEIFKSVDTVSGSDAGSENVSIVGGGEGEGGYTSKGLDSNKLCH